MAAGTPDRYLDASPWNAVWADGVLAGFVDWDTASPSRREDDLAFSALTWVPLLTAEIARGAGFGDAYDNALAESQIGLFKAELFHPHGPWRDRDHLEPAILDWVTWFNTERPHESIDDLTPVAAEQLHYRYRASLAEAS